MRRRVLLNQGGQDESAIWLAHLLSPECDSEEHVAFESWLAKDPRNVIEYAEVERLHYLAGNVVV